MYFPKGYLLTKIVNKRVSLGQSYTFWGKSGPQMVYLNNIGPINDKVLCCTVHLYIHAICKIKFDSVKYTLVIGTQNKQFVLLPKHMLFAIDCYYIMTIQAL